MSVHVRDYHIESGTFGRITKDSENKSINKVANTSETI